MRRVVHLFVGVPVPVWFLTLRPPPALRQDKQTRVDKSETAKSYITYRSNSSLHTNPRWIQV